MNGRITDNIHVPDLPQIVEQGLFRDDLLKLVRNQTGNKYHNEPIHREIKLEMRGLTESSPAY